MRLNLSIGILVLSIAVSSSMDIKPTRSQILNVTTGDISASELSVVKNKIDLIRLSGKQVKLVGYYVSQSWKPGLAANTIDFKGEYTISQIILEDGTVVSIFPPGNKQSLRSSDEASKYKGKIVEAIGTIQFEGIVENNPKPHGSFINLKELKLV